MLGLKLNHVSKRGHRSVTEISPPREGMQLTNWKAVWNSQIKLGNAIRMLIRAIRKLSMRISVLAFLRDNMTIYIIRY